MIHPLDHLLVVVIAALFPLYSYREVRKAERRLAEPGAAPFDTVREYRLTIAWLVVLAALCLANWFFQGRDAGVLGLGAGATPLRWVAGAALALAGLGLTWQQSRQLKRDPDARATLRAQLGRLEFMLPHTSRDLRWFEGVSLAAGLCELLEDGPTREKMLTDMREVNASLGPPHAERQAAKAVLEAIGQQGEKADANG